MRIKCRLEIFFRFSSLPNFAQNPKHECDDLQAAVRGEPAAVGGE